MDWFIPQKCHAYPFFTHEQCFKFKTYEKRKREKKRKSATPQGDSQGGTSGPHPIPEVVVLLFNLLLLLPLSLLLLQSGQKLEKLPSTERFPHDSFKTSSRRWKSLIWRNLSGCHRLKNREEMSRIRRGRSGRGSGKSSRFCGLRRAAGQVFKTCLR